MTNPIVIAHHLIWTAYGWWLPNDPRGSMSREVCSDIIAELGELHYGRKRVQPASHEIRTFYNAATGALKHSLSLIGPAETRAVAEAFTDAITHHRYTCYAAAIMTDHIHILIRKHKHQAEDMIANLQSASRLRLGSDHLRTPDHPVWGGPGWKVFLHHPDEIRRTIRYIRDNPRRLNMSAQTFSFVKDYDGWPLHPGHSPNSPYARRMKASGRE